MGYQSSAALQPTERRPDDEGISAVGWRFTLAPLRILRGHDEKGSTMPTPLQETIWLTPAAHGKLREEFDELTRRNPAPAPAVEARIRELRAILRQADVSDKPDDGLVEPGMTVTVQFDGDAEPTTFLLAQRGIAEGGSQADLEVYPPTSPLGVAIVGKYPEDRFAFTAPSGTEVTGRIVSAVPFRSLSS
jgi:transcription elongation factor GreA